MGFSTIIALDLGKFDTVACIIDVATRTHAFETIDMPPKSVHDLVARRLTSSPADTLLLQNGHMYLAPTSPHVL